MSPFACNPRRCRSRLPVRCGLGDRICRERRSSGITKDSQLQLTKSPSRRCRCTGRRLPTWQDWSAVSPDRRYGPRRHDAAGAGGPWLLAQPLQASPSLRGASRHEYQSIGAGELTHNKVPTLPKVVSLRRNGVGAPIQSQSRFAGAYHFIELLILDPNFSPISVRF